MNTSLSYKKKQREKNQIRIRPFYISYDLTLNIKNIFQQIFGIREVLHE